MGFFGSFLGRFLGLVIALLLTTNFASAATSTSAGETKSSIESVLDDSKRTSSITKGTLWVNARAGAGYGSFSGFIYSLQPTAQYFLTDRFSAGLLSGIRGSNSLLSSQIGPTASYYFYKGENWAWYLNQSLLVTSTDRFYDVGADTKQDYTRTESRTGLGMVYMIDRSVAIDTQFAYDIPLSDTRFGNDLDQPVDFNFLVGVSFYFDPTN